MASFYRFEILESKFDKEEFVKYNEITDDELKEMEFPQCSRMMKISAIDNGAVSQISYYGYLSQEEYLERILAYREGNILNLNGVYLEILRFPAEMKRIRLNLSYSFIYAEAVWDGVSIAEATEIKECIFNSNVYLCKNETKDLRFKNCTFNGKVKLWDMRALGNLMFHNCTFEKEVLMERTDCEKELDFRLSDFKRNFTWLESRAGSIVLMDSKFREGLFLTESCCEKADLTYAVTQEEVNIQLRQCRKLILNEMGNRGEFTLRRSGSLEMLCVNHLSNSGNIQIYVDFEAVRDALRRSVYYDFHEGGWYYEERKCSKQQIAEQYNLLKQIYRRAGEYRNEDAAYYEFSRYYRKSIDSPWKIKGGRRIRDFLAYYLYKPVSWLFLDLCGGYGTKPHRAVAGILFTILLFGALYSLPLCRFRQTASLWDNWYISGIAFFTIGFGDIVPLNLMAKLLTVLEGFVGVLQMSYFTVSFARRTLR